MKHHVCVNLTHPFTKRIIFLLLLTTVIVVLLRNTKVYNLILSQWQETSVYSCFTRSGFELKTSSSPDTTRNSTTSSRSTPSTTRSKPAVQRCSYSYLSPENAEEGRRLLDSITWPETQPLPEPFSLSVTTSGDKSSFGVVPRSGGWRVGDELTVTVQLRDFNGNPKKGGGDFVVSRLHNRELGAGVVGQVEDHLNGTFTAVLPLLWKGTAEVEVTLVQTSESIRVLNRLTQDQPDRIFFTSEFRSGSVKEKTTCNVCLDPGKRPLCNFTDIYTGEQWFCIKPDKLDCSSRVSHHSAGFSGKISKQEESLFQNGINLKVPLKPLADKGTILILPKAGESKEVRPGPSGYYFRNQWLSLRGPDVRSFNSASDITACLSGKQLHLFGDSTIRQFYEYITQTAPNLLRFDKHASTQTGPFMAVDHNNDIVVTYRCHQTPLRFSYVLVSQMRYVATELDGLAGGPDSVVVIGVWAHFSSYPLEVYYQRLMTIRRAVRRLLRRAPETRVIVRSANMKKLDLFHCLTQSDWYALQRDRLLRAVFRDVDVLLLDAWEMVLANDLPHDLHPPPPIIKQMIDVVLSYACPGKK